MSHDLFVFSDPACYKRLMHMEFCSQFVMAAAKATPDWDSVLKGKYVSYNVEINAYLESLEIATSSDISMQKIYFAIRNEPSVHENLKAMYKEALFGKNKEVKARIKNRISNFRRNYRLIFHAIFILSLNVNNFHYCQYE